MNFRTMFRTFESFRKIVLNIEFFKDPAYRKALFLDSLNELQRLNAQLQKNEKTILHTFKVDREEKPLPDEYNCLIIDLEGDDPVKLLGLLVSDTIYSYLLPEKYSVSDFYRLIFRILEIFQDSLLFGFTFWDYDMLFTIKDSIFSNSLNNRGETKDILERIKYFNLQERDRESVAEALYSLGSTLPRDPLYRRNYHINQLWEDGFYDIIRQHNCSCLRAELAILKGRYLPKYVMYNKNKSKIKNSGRKKRYESRY